MHALRTRPAGRVDQLVGGEVALGRRRRPDQDRLIADSGVESPGVGLRIHGDRAHAEPCRRTRNTNRDLATIGDQDRREHGYAISSGRRRIYVAGRFPGEPVENRPCTAVPRVEPPGPAFFFFNDTATTEIYTLSLHDALPI